MKLNTGAKEIQQVNPGGPDDSKTSDPYHLINRSVFKSPLFAYILFYQDLNKNEKIHPTTLKTEMDWFNC